LSTFLIISAHILFDAAAGSALLHLRKKEEPWPEVLVFSVLLGMYVETISIATLMFLGVSLNTAVMTAGGLMLALISVALYRQGRIVVPKPAPFSLKFYEWALLAAIGEKVLFVAWQLSRMPTYFQDALMHWSGRALALYGGVNWSLDAASPLFMGAYSGNNNYPLNLVVWRAVSAKLQGGWNEVISRADGLVFFLLIVAIVWIAVWRFSGQRWLAAAAAYAATALPLHAWHAAAGYSDIAVEAFCAASVAAMLRGRWFWAGMLAAGAAWSKNDALVLYTPALILAATIMRHRLRDTMGFLLGFSTIAPWLLFNLVHHLGVTPTGRQLAWHSGALTQFLQTLIAGSTNGILWLAIAAGTVCTFLAARLDRTAAALALLFMLPMATIAFTFTSTNAYEFLRDGTTINRVLMQYTSMAILVAAYGISQFAKRIPLHGT
jgi:hypothetical protein